MYHVSVDERMINGYYYMARLLPPFVNIEFVYDMPFVRVEFVMACFLCLGLRSYV